MNVIDKVRGYVGLGGGQGKFWWVHGKTRDGKVVFLGKFEDEDEAESQLARLRSGRTFCFPTDNYQKAKTMALKQLLKDGEDTGEARHDMADAPDFVGRQKRDNGQGQY